MHGDGSAPGGFTLVAFVVQFSVAASYNITYAPYVSDYSRYLPRKTPPTAIIASVFIGAVASPAWLIPLGAWMATCLGRDRRAGRYQRDRQRSGFPTWAACWRSSRRWCWWPRWASNAYSGMLTVVTAWIRSRRSIRLASCGWSPSSCSAVVWLVMSLLLTNATTALNTTLLIMLYLLAPWTAVNLTDYFFVRSGHYAIADLFTPNGIYGAWSWRGLDGVPRSASPPRSRSSTCRSSSDPPPRPWGVDIAFIVGLLVSGVVYMAFTRSLDVPASYS